MPRKNKGRNILICRFSALGDVAMTLPSVYDACRANPSDNFFFLTRRHPAQIFINTPANLTVIGVDLENYPGPSGMWHLASSLRLRYGIDLFVDLHDVVRTKLLRCFFAFRGVRVACIRKGRSAKKRLTRRNNKVLIQLKPTTLRYEETFARAGIALDGSFHSLYGKGKGDPVEFASVTQQKKEGDYWLAIAPFAKHSGKIYPFELTAKVIGHFASKPGYRIFIFGFGKREEEIIAGAAAGHDNIVNMASAGLGIGAELALLSHCDAMLSMDSANMHLASLVGLRTVSIWGATHPYTGFLGWRQNPADAVQLDMTCRPCSVFGDKPCHRGDRHCLWGITPQMIIQRLQIPSDRPL